MRRTLNEVHRTCQKAAEGAGAPAGLDSDAAEAAVWLAARGLDVLDGLAGELERLAGQPEGCALEDGAPLDATGKAGALVAPLLVDLLVARALSDGRAMADGRARRLEVTGLTSPLFLLPPAARYAADGWHFRFALAGDARYVLSAGPDGAAILGPAGTGAGGGAGALAGAAGFGLRATCARSADGLAEDGEAGLTEDGEPDLAVLADAESLTAAAARNWEEGVQASPALWDRLQVFARKTLVPATEESRRRGAGELGGG